MKNAKWATLAMQDPEIATWKLLDAIVTLGDQPGWIVPMIEIVFAK